VYDAKKISQYLTRKQFVQKIMEHPADLSEFRERPTVRLITGLILLRHIILDICED